MIHHALCVPTSVQRAVLHQHVVGVHEVDGVRAWAAGRARSGHAVHVGAIAVDQAQVHAGGVPAGEVHTRGDTECFETWGS